MIREITINHYKSIKDPVHLRDLSGFHILVGSNNAGKTNLFDAIHLFFEKNTDQERFFDKDADLDIVLSFEEQDHKMSYKEGELVKGGELDVGRNFARIDHSYDPQQVARKLESFKKEHPEAYENFSRALENNFQGVQISEELFLMNVRSDHKDRPMKRMGDGLKRLFVILFHLFHPHYKVILIDEPEMHLHPSVIRKFLRILEDVGSEKQILITTHHPTFIQAKHLPRTWRIARNERESTSVYGFSGKEDSLERFVQEMNDDNSAMLFADKTLLVEGVSDRIFMREIINRFYKKDKDIKVVYTGGKGSVDIYAKLCEVFNIPYAIMLDRDALNSVPLTRIQKYPSFKKGTNQKKKIEELKKKEIFILKKDLEQAYPSHYKHKETKPLTALHISQRITEEELEKMETIKEILETI